ncbi:FAD:protein FMN transferase [Dyadobacter chenhuakuii]|uniref:FAD:protein FMN transferase n=1 Tax=Dyadobacter chenhuakuii TaxID=2909339 RepID=A0ABY4XJE2_9BACT|nr:FAD:protein FMN transferase [Dyadobacter chenhuakuii]MCF2496103.1 FAD:protein FMN transferase [Dyadobacter chenhuakuii]USJ30168.1 FAD:protein FMN transferase [Dyadobacter chenhuakuii]
MRLSNYKQFLLAGIAILVLPAFCILDIPETKSFKRFQISGLAQGTSYAVTYYAESESVKKSQIDSIFGQLDHSLSIYNPNSIISRFNASDSGVDIDDHFYNVVRKSQEIFKETEGAFDITVYPLVRAWGFGNERVSAIPDAAKIQSSMPCIGSEKLHLSSSRLTKDLPCVKIDVNGIAQGYSVDVMANFLESNGIANYLVEIGGEIRVKGRKYPENTAMSIGIEKPAENEFQAAGIRQVIQVPDGAVTTSGSYRNFRKLGSRRISHIIDPKTGYPASTEIISATVIADDAITADGYDNALLLMGLDHAMEFLKRRKNLHAYFIFQRPDSTIADTTTAGFSKFLKP